MQGERTVFIAEAAVLLGASRRTVYKAELMRSDNPAHMSGIFDLADPRNAVRDWSMVFVPYCTGDVHSGSNTARYQNPQTGQPTAYRPPLYPLLIAAVLRCGGSDDGPEISRAGIPFRSQ